MALRVVFFGTPDFAVPTLARLLASSHQIAAVVTQPDRPRGRGHQVSDGPVKALAVVSGLPVLQPPRLTRDGFETAFNALGADLGVVAAYGKILPDWLLAAPRLGLINVHASLLPRHRGASPVHRAVMAGDRMTGVTIMRVVTALDAGPMLAQVAVPIGSDDTAVDVERVLAARGADLLVDIVNRLAAGPVTATAQDASKVTHAPKLTKADGLINWSRMSVDLHNQVRGLTPWPRAYTFLGGTRYIIHKSRVAAWPLDASSPGTIVAASPHEGVLVACGNRTALEIVDLQLEGRRVMNAREALVAGSLRVGARFSVS